MIYKKFLTELDTSFVVINYQYTIDRVNLLNNKFNPNGINAIAIKTNPLKKNLEILKNYNQYFEAASIGEIAIALAAGVNSEHIIFDSPVKTNRELNYLENHVQGAFINADNYDELQRLQKLSGNFKIGLRINPNVNIDTISSVNVSKENSKFGELISNINIDQISKIKQLDTLHVHQASQNNDFNNTISGIRKVVDLANKLPKGKIKYINIGGGLGFNYYTSEEVNIGLYFNKLTNDCPELFNGTYTLITEFGRFYYAGGASVFSKVETIKYFPSGKALALIHVGADMFLREAYNNSDWHHNLMVYDNKFTPKLSEEIMSFDIGGPLCFAGDIPFKNHKLPKLEIGDWINIQDAGANTFSLWSRHCSREFPLVLGLINDEIFVIKKRESLDDLVKFWT